MFKVEKIQKKTTDHVVATTTVTVPKEGPVIACATIETFPKGPKGKIIPSAPPKTSSDTESDASEAIRNFPYTSSPNLYSNNRLFTRPHCFRNKTVLKPSEECGVCGKKYEKKLGFYPFFFFEKLSFFSYISGSGSEIKFFFVQIAKFYAIQNVEIKFPCLASQWWRLQEETHSPLLLIIVAKVLQ